MDGQRHIANVNVSSRSLKTWQLRLHCIFVLRMHTDCYFRASDQNCDIAIRFSDPNFEIWRSDTLWPWPLILDLERVSGVTWSKSVTSLTEIVQSAAELANFSRRYVTLWPWPLTPWPWASAVLRLTCSNSVLNFSEMENPRLSYWRFSIFFAHFSVSPPENFFWKLTCLILHSCDYYAY